MTVRAVSLDAYGTLIHAPKLVGIYAEVLERHGIVVPPPVLAGLIPEVWEEFASARRPEVDRFAGHPRGARGFWHDVAVRLCERLGERSPSRFASAELYDRFARPDAWAVYPEVPTVLEALRARGFRLAVLSNFDERLPSILRGLGLDGWFEVIVYSEAVGVEKPRPEIFEVLLQRLKLPPEAVVHVGDTRLDDEEGAHGAGLHGLWLTRHDAGGLTSLAGLLDWLPGRPVSA